MGMAFKIYSSSAYIVWEKRHINEKAARSYRGAGWTILASSSFCNQDAILLDGWKIFAGKSKFIHYSVLLNKNITSSVPIKSI